MEQSGRDLPPGFRFRPTLLEMSKYFLPKKALGQPMKARTIPQDFNLIFSTHPRNLPGDQKEKHWYYYCRKRNDQVTTIPRSVWTPIGEETNVFDPDQNGELVGIKRQFEFIEEESSDICLCDGEESPKYNWFMDEISLPSTVAVTDWVLCHVFRKKIKPKTPVYFEEEKDETKSE